MKNANLKNLSAENFGELPNALKWLNRNIVLSCTKANAVDEDPKARSALKLSIFPPSSGWVVDEDPKARSALKLTLRCLWRQNEVDEDPKARSALKRPVRRRIDLRFSLMKTPKHEVH